jgi:histidinol-phosphate/aromatic aminotransferase/cobyric acid decarboxylase-like protein
MANLQVRWSVNGFAHHFFIAAMKDRHEVKEMSETTPVCRAETIRMLKELGVKSKDGLPMWVPFVDVDMLSLEIAEKPKICCSTADFPSAVANHLGSHSS